jgi:uncharacterized protein (UPF0276 family)
LSAVRSAEHKLHGIGVGLRQAIAAPLFELGPSPEIRFVEIHPENFIERAGRFRGMLERARASWPILTHGLTLGVGAVEPAERHYVQQLKRFLAEIDAPWHSEHLCFSSPDGVMMHDLMPLPFRREAIDVAVARICELRDALELPIAIENVSYYAHPGPQEMSEADFLVEVLERADAKLLLDVNNVYVNCRNHKQDPQRFLERMPMGRVVQVHVAGHTQRNNGLLIDTHGEAIRDEVYALLHYTLGRVGPVPVLLERDQNFPTFDVLRAELSRLNSLYLDATGATWD